MQAQELELLREEASDEVEASVALGRTRHRAVAALAAAGLLLGAAAVAVSKPPAELGRVQPHVRGALGLSSEAPPCLCVFDIDRTLTGKQGWKSQCEQNREVLGATDIAYAGGTLLFSDLKENLQSSFCGKCFAGIVTAGTGSGANSTERKEILAALGGTAKTRSDWWQDVGFNPSAKVGTSLVVQASDGKKQDSLISMLDWWKRDQHLDIAREDVYFFDDIASNVQPFEGTGMNAQQISCQSRGPAESLPGSFDGKLGGCGGLASEATGRKGVHVC